MNTDKIASKAYYKFSFLEGNQHIANEYALKCILRIIKSFEVKNVLEVGVGIGCIADTILEYSNEINYSATEANEFCLNEIKKNINQIDRIELYSKIEDIPSEKSFDLIIVDGLDDTMDKIKILSHKRSIIFIEGGRFVQLKMLKSLFPKLLHTELISSYKNPNYGPFLSENWSGGGQLIFPNPTIRMKLYYFKEKISTYIKRKIRVLM